MLLRYLPVAQTPTHPDVKMFWQLNESQKAKLKIEKNGSIFIVEISLRMQPNWKIKYGIFKIFISQSQKKKTKIKTLFNFYFLDPKQKLKETNFVSFLLVLNFS